MRIGKLLSSILLFISFLIVFPNSIIADPLDSWHLRYSSSNILNTVAYGNGTFVAVGKQGTILNSVDGITWGPKTSGTSMDLEGVTYGNSTFVAVGDHGTILISPDGGTWTPRTPYSGTTENLSGIAYGNGIFVAVGDYRTVLTSPDGYTWTARTLASGTFSYFPYAVYFGNGTFVSVDVSGDIFTSTNGLTWTERESPNFFSFFGVAYGNDTFVAVGQLGTVYTSPDGTTWTERNSGTSEDFDGVAYGNNTFVAVGYSMNYGGIIFTSPDGVVWTQRNSGTNKILYGVTYGEGTFVAVGGVILQSDPMPAPYFDTVTITATDITATEAGPTTGTFTVTRTGSTAAALTVYYNVSGTATPGSDYISLPGSVTIAAGSPSAPITVTPINDTQVESNETVIATLSSNPAYTVGSPNNATVTIIDNVMLNSTEFVKQQYRDFLNREAEPGGLQYWVNIIDSRAMTRAQVIESFFWSNEFGATIAPIVRLYFAYFLRIPDYEGLMFWIDQFSNGQSLEAISDSFAGSEEFQQTYGALSNEAFVNLVYQNILGRAPDSGGFAFWVGELNSGRRTRGQVMIGFSESAEYERLTSYEVYVTMMYVGMLRRSPEEEGFNFWVDYLDSGNSGLALIDGFLNSQEYANRF